MGIEAFRFQEDLVTEFVRELDDLVLDGRAVSRSDAFDLTTI
jgi:hypothetical protein